MEKSSEKLMWLISVPMTQKCVIITGWLKIIEKLILPSAVF